MRLVLASNNAKKLIELQGLLGALPLALVTQGSLGVAEAEEPHRTFVENALAKARHAAQHTGGAAIADDSGLYVQALGGLPGVDSAHIAPLSLDAAWGVDASANATMTREAVRARQDAANNAWLLQSLQGHRNRAAHYVCVLVALRHADDPQPLVAHGLWQGEVLHAPQGEGGFGYDPLMLMHAQTVSVGAMHPLDKQRLSHRALAAVQMVALMRAAWSDVLDADRAGTAP
jgi:XTP/dITP diphosphohydrolase